MFHCRLFGAKCEKCHENFNKNDYVMRARHKIYHVQCFHCVACSLPLRPGDEFALRDDGLYCKADHDILEQNSIQTPLDNGVELMGKLLVQLATFQAFMFLLVRWLIYQCCSC